MPLINTAAAVYLGGQRADRVYLGGDLVWSATAEVAGLPAGWAGTPIAAADLTITSATYTDLDITGSLVIPSGVDARFVRCRLTGSGGPYGIETADATASVVLEHCEITGDYAAAGLRGANLTASWCELVGLPADGVKLENGNRITDCRIRGFVPGPGAHVDGVQMETDAGDILVARCTIEVPGAGQPGIEGTTGAIFVVPQLAGSYGPRAAGDIVIEDCLLSGGSSTVHIGDGEIDGVPTPLLGLRFRRNRFVPNAVSGPVYPTEHVPAEWVDNIVQGTGEVVPPPGVGGGGDGTSWVDPFTAASLDPAWLLTAASGSVIYPAAGGSSVELVCTDPGATIWVSGASATRLGRLLADDPQVFDLRCVLLDPSTEAGLYVQGTDITRDFIKFGIYANGSAFTLGWASDGSPQFLNGNTPGVYPNALRISRNGNLWTAYYATVADVDDLTGTAWTPHTPAVTSGFVATRAGIYVGGADSPRFSYAALTVP